MKPNRSDVIAALVLATLAMLCWVPRLQGPIDLRWDGAAYYILGTALAEGKGYRLLNEPGDIQSTLHPPMLPTLIALHRWIVRTNDPAVLGHWLRLTYVVFFISYVVAGYFMLRLFLPTTYSSLAALVFALQLHTIFMSDLCFPEIPFGLAKNLHPCHRRNRRLMSPTIRAMEEIGGLCHLRSHDRTRFEARGWRARRLARLQARL